MSARAVPNASRIAVLALTMATSCRGDHAPAAPQPHTFNDAEIQAALHRAAGVATAAPCKFEHWRQMPGAVVALCASTTAAATTIIGPHVVLAVPDHDQLEPVASGQLVITETKCDLIPGDMKPSHEVPTFDLDLAPYVVAHGRSAIGVRFTCHNEFKVGEGHETRLYLLEQSGAELRQIFDQPVTWSRTDRGNRRQSVTHGGVVKQPSIHAGHFDLALETTTFENDYPVGTLEPERTATQRFIFDGSRYVAAPAQ
jgi:hypothetical protein